MADNELENRLRKIGTKYAKEITKEAKINLGGKSRLINVASITSWDGGKLTIKTEASNIAVDEYGDTKNVAHAYEYGSGIHGKKHAKYRIQPKRKKVLAFYWEKFDTNPEIASSVFNSPKFVGITPDGRPMFRFVDHPGVLAVKNGRGYMKPAIDKIRPKLKGDLSKEMGEAAMLTIKRSFKK